MQQQQQNQGIQLDLRNTEPIFNEQGSPLFAQGVILRKVSKFVTGAPEDSMVPIAIFYDPQTMKIYEESIPPQLRDEYVEYYASKTESAQKNE